jgi:hypothetical protein
LGSTPSNGSSSSSASPASGGAELYTYSNVEVGDGVNLDYNSAGGHPILFWDWYSLGYLMAGDGVELAVLPPPTPGKTTTAYQACESIGSSSYVTRVELNSLAVGATICAFTPNQQIIWIWFLPPDQANSLLIDGTAWEGRKS